MNRSLALLLSFALVACGATEQDPADQSPDAGVQPDAGAVDPFSFYMDACRAHPSEIVGARIQVAGGEDVLFTKDSPEDPSPWCEKLTANSFEVSDAREGVSGKATFALAIDGNTYTVSGTTQASGTGPVVTASSGFTLLDIRGGGGGIERARVTVKCSGTATGSLSGARVELANGEPVCSTSPLSGGWDQTTVIFEESVSDDPHGVILALRNTIDALGGDDPGVSSSAQASFEITVEPL